MIDGKVIKCWYAQKRNRTSGGLWVNNFFKVSNSISDSCFSSGLVLYDRIVFALSHDFLSPKETLEKAILMFWLDLNFQLS